MPRTVLLLPAAFLLAACPQESREVTTAVVDGKLVFDSDRNDCLVRYSIDEGPGDGRGVPVWQVESPMPISNDASCRARFPLRYGEPPAGVSAYPEGAAPVLRSGARYHFLAEGMNYIHKGDFTAP